MQSSLLTMMNSNDLADDNEEILDTVTSSMLDACGEPFLNEVLQFDSIDSNNIIDENEHNVSESEAISENDLGLYFGGAPVQMEDDLIEMPPQRRCVSHLLNRLSQVFEQKYLNETAKAAVCHTMSKLHTLWVLTRCSSHAKTICKSILGEVLKIPTETRWNSRFDSVKMCNRPEIQKNLNKLIHELKSNLACMKAQNLQTLTTSDFVVIDLYVKVFEPVAVALDCMQKEFNSSQGFIMPVLISMRHRVTQMPNTPNIARDFKESMLKAIDDRFKNYFLFEDSNEDLLLASVTLPSVKVRFIKEDEHIIKVKNMLIAQCKKFKNEMCVETGTSQSDPVPTQDDDFIISYSTFRDNRRSSIESEIESEVARFLFDHRTENSSLNEYPNVRGVYFKYNTTISSSAPVERVFSQSMMIFTPRRNRLSAIRFEQTLLMKHNRKLINDSKTHADIC